MAINNLYIFMKFNILFTTALFWSSSICLAGANHCTNKQECFPKEGATWYLFESDRIDKKISVELKNAQNIFVKQIKLPDLRNLLQSQFKKALEVSDLECEMIYYLSRAGSHWPGVHVSECKISYKKNHLTALMAAQACIGNGTDEDECIPLLFKVTPKDGLNN